MQLIEQNEIAPEFKKAENSSLDDEINNALEMIKRIHTVNNVREANSASSQGSFSYFLPQPVYLCQVTN